MAKTKVGIVGVAGYGGGQLASLLINHPDVEVAYISSNSASGLPIGEILPGFLGRSSLIADEFSMPKMLDSVDLVFAAQAGGWAIENARIILDSGKKLIDISADFRLRNPDSYRNWYKDEPASAELQSKAVYGMPELFRDQVKDAEIISNPGCYPTSAILALAPAVKHKLIDESAIIINSMSGVSGAGRTKQTLMYHFPELNENAQAYGVAGKHRHTPEIEQALSDVAGHEIIVSFTPHLIPITRGILTTIVVPLSDGIKFESVQDIYNESYKYEPFVHMRDSKNLPTTKQTLGSNNLLISLDFDKRTNRLTIISAEDNLVKGMAGQAIQNMNIMLGIDEAAGLNLPGQWP